jgi:hypothetical protein
MEIPHVEGRGPRWVVGIAASVLVLVAVAGTLAVRWLPVRRDAGVKQVGTGVVSSAPSRSPEAAQSVQVLVQPVASEPGPTGAGTGPDGSGGGQEGTSANGQRSLLLWPFTSARQVTDWEASYRDGGHQPWHASPCETASSFVQYVLGFNEVSQIASCQISGSDAWVTPGYHGQDGVDPTGATIHLIRIGSHPGGWVVVGSRDRATLTVPTPRYGAAVGRTVHLAGDVQGLGEDVLTVRILDRSGRTIGQAPRRMISLGGAWSADIHLPATTDPVLIAVASTDSGRGSLADLAITAIVMDQ